MIDFYQRSHRATARTFGARVLLVALGLAVGMTATVYASTAPNPVGPGLPLAQTTLDSSKSAVRSVGLPPVSPDNPLVSIPTGVTFSRAQGWLSRVILVRQAALLSLSKSLTAQNVILASDRVQLSALIGSALTRLNTIANDASSDTTVAAVRHQARQVMNLQILNLVVPQVHLLSRVDSLRGLAAQLSANESAAAASIAISRATASSVNSEQALDQTIKSLAQAITSELQLTQDALLSRPGSADIAAGVFANAKVSLLTASSQLRIANTDLRNLVVHLVAR